MSFCNWSLTTEGTRHGFDDVEVSEWSIGGRVYRTDDTSRPRTDGRYFGQDFVDPGDVEIQLLIRVTTGPREDRFRAVSTIKERFTSFWDGDDIRLRPGVTSELEIAGRYVVEGRPRHVDWDDTLATFGIVKGTALFVRGQDEAFAVEPGGGSAWNEVTVGLVPAQIGGLIAPLIAPLTTAESSTRARPFTVNGDVPVWPIISVKGPIQTGAQVELVHGWTLRLNRALAFDETATIDTRPGHRTMDVNGQAQNVLSPSGARISQASIPPGLQEIALRGQSVEGTAEVTIRWRESKKVF